MLKLARVMRTVCAFNDGLATASNLRSWATVTLAIDIAPMADSDYVDNPLPIIDAIDNPIVANPNPPQILFALQFA